ncbi:nose resistant to fluoxetine protein 6-like [Elysia marginata]|uniref:Nose resistant to fluoxetine protein 6-like n=1 Tax=Elysia marginata TaxID=1093978 RepID=A0AAV4FXN5_9GAST|nr:nose resistant to fluoxetine protein 6-like [Elysia marginata]
MLVIVLILGLQQYCGEGPQWASVQPHDKTKCEKYWWTNLLYINNLVSIDKMCLGQAWYMGADMQFYVISPLMIIPFYFKPLYGLASCSVLLVTHVVATGILSVHNKWRPSPVLAED